ncbi:RING finger protein 17-like [Erpetoichthys calabaricus]|uniref:RING finger protein 17-like n=1 Tax=Erpetoichthys calabaricus TaxID=27687 RepID=UPI002234CA15|nr:RING finger protein 17-like [Erpetoichthys calabaricus]
MALNFKCQRCARPYIVPEDETVGNLPRLLLCGHVFCQSCLHDMKQVESVKCPHCGVETTLVNHDVESLPFENKIIENLFMEKMEINKNKSPGESTQDIGYVCEMGSEKFSELDKAVSSASEYLNYLNAAQMVLNNGLEVQIKHDKFRLSQEIETAFNTAYEVLLERRKEMIEEVNANESFIITKELLKKIEKKKRDLENIMQTGKQVRQFPVLLNCLDLEKVLILSCLKIYIIKPKNYLCSKLFKLFLGIP